MTFYCGRPRSASDQMRSIVANPSSECDSQFKIITMQKKKLWHWSSHSHVLSFDGIKYFKYFDVKSPACPSMVSLFSVRNRVFLRRFPCVLHNPRPTWFLCCLGTVGRWRLHRYTVSAGSPTMLAGLWSNVTFVRTGFTAGMYIILSFRSPSKYMCPRCFGTLSFRRKYGHVMRSELQSWGSSCVFIVTVTDIWNGLASLTLFGL